MRAKVDIDIEFPQLHAPSERAVIAAIRAGLFQGGTFLQSLWGRIAQAERIWGTGAYMRGIQEDGVISVRKVRGSDTTSSYEAEIIVTNTARHASIIEEGHAAFSLVQAINWASVTGRIKRTKTGKPYLNIPFRHSAFAGASQRDEQGLTGATRKAMMPEIVYQQAVALASTLKMNVGPITRKAHTASGDEYAQFVAADRYARGGSLHRGNVRTGFHGDTGGELFEERRSQRSVGRGMGGGRLVNPEWKSSRFEGMFKSGPKGHTEYMTIRTITPTSTGWNIPAQAGHYIAHKTGLLGVRDNRFAEVVLGGVQAVLGA